MSRKDQIITFKACRKCGYLVENLIPKCPACGSVNFSMEYEGLIIILDKDKSEVAKKLKKGVNGKYAIKVY
jgi:DNA-directed RNA polymerase subunit E"